MAKATYNIVDDKLKVWFDARLSKEEYDLCRGAGFSFWHGSKCFVSKWRPDAEDYIKKHGIEIAADDRPDDVEARVERFTKYAEGAEQAAESAENHLQSDRCNTERRRENAANAIEKNVDLAKHWQSRIQGAISHAQFKERPDVIARRTKELEADRRRHEASYTPHKNKDGKVEVYKQSDGLYVYVGPKGGRGGSYIEVEKLPAVEAYAKRWIEHIDRRLEYERASLAAAGGIEADKSTLEVMGSCGGLLITKINKTTIEVFDPKHFNSWFPFIKVEVTDSCANSFRTAAQVVAETPHLLDRWAEWQKETGCKSSNDRRNKNREEIAARHGS